MIDEILDEFNFEKVHKVMVALDWQYHNTDGVPTIGDLRRMARSLLKQVVESKNLRYTASGGFVAYMEDGILGLRFEVASYEKGIGQ
jgi:hypothetical protein